MKIDLTSPIVPGHSAGGILVGAEIEAVLAANEIEFKKVERTEEITLYQSDHIDFAVDETGKIYQIMVHGGYLGKIQDKVGLGSTYEDVGTHLGRVGEDWEDNMVVKEFPGFCFEHTPSSDGPPFLLTHICVFVPEDPSLYPDGFLDIRY
jgi:hypothetical protein